MSENAIETPKATCAYCGKDYTKGGMTRHLQACKKRQESVAGEQPKDTIYHLSVQASYIPLFWMHIEIAGSKQLQHLDQFLRDVWLECCGHLSEFTIAGIGYHARPMHGYNDQSMQPKIDTVLSEGLEFSHTYDFGTSTDLWLKVVATRQGKLPTKRNTVKILARNHSPEITCSVCHERDAVWFSNERLWEDQSPFICEVCSGIEEDDEAYENSLLPVVNSPRMGECGFMGAHLT